MEIAMPPLGKVIYKEQVIFEGAEPVERFAEVA